MQILGLFKYEHDKNYWDSNQTAVDRREQESQFLQILWAFLKPPKRDEASDSFFIELLIFLHESNLKPLSEILSSIEGKLNF